MACAADFRVARDTAVKAHDAFEDKLCQPMKQEFDEYLSKESDVTSYHTEQAFVDGLLYPNIDTGSDELKRLEKYGKMWLEYIHARKPELYRELLLTVQAGTYGLEEERKCTNAHLMSYGNFTSENILQSIQFNDFVLDTAWQDFSLLSEILGALGAIDHPDDPQAYERIFLETLQPEDFKGKTKLQIEQILAERKFQELLATQTKAIQERIVTEQAQSAMLHQSIAGLFDQFEQWLWEKKLQEDMLKNELQITGDTKEAKIYEDDEYESY